MCIESVTRDHPTKIATDQEQFYTKSRHAPSMKPKQWMPSDGKDITWLLQGLERFAFYTEDDSCASPFGDPNWKHYEMRGSGCFRECTRSWHQEGIACQAVCTSSKSSFVHLRPPMSFKMFMTRIFTYGPANMQWCWSLRWFESCRRSVVMCVRKLALGCWGQAYRKLALQYHPDKNPGNKQAPKKVFPMIDDVFDCTVRMTFQWP